MLLFTGEVTVLRSLYFCLNIMALVIEEMGNCWRHASFDVDFLVYNNHHKYSLNRCCGKSVHASVANCLSSK